MSDPRPDLDEGKPSEKPDDREAEAEAEETAATVPDKPKSYGTILAEEIFQGLHELERPTSGLFLSGMSAGLDIGFSVLLMAVLLTLLGGHAPPAVVEIALANAYTVGFIFVILGRSELFTEHTALAVFPVLGRRTSFDRLVRLWGIVYVSNILGAALFTLLMVWIAPQLRAVRPEVFASIARRLTDHPAHVILASGILAGWMMGLLSWLLSAAQETISRIVIVWLVTGAIGLMRLHHSILGTVEVLAGVFTDPSLSVADYGRFLLWSSVGNALGGVFLVAVVKFGHAVQGPPVPPRVSARRRRERRRGNARGSE